MEFQVYKPGLVGGHCIGVDPYYLTFKAKEIGYEPELILAGRRLNEAMSAYVAESILKLMIKKGASNLSIPRYWVLGLTFKQKTVQIIVIQRFLI